MKLVFRQYEIVVGNLLNAVGDLLNNVNEVQIYAKGGPGTMEIHIDFNPPKEIT